ncbi:MAG: chemotaxis protein CheW [Methylophilaceae bacterium]
MAKTSNLREFQELILLKLKEAKAEGATESRSRLGVLVGDKHMLINLIDIVEVLPVPTVKPVPFTQPWFLGVSNVRGVLYNLTDLAQFMRLPAPDKTIPKSIHSRILLLRSQVTTQAALMVTSLLGLRNIDEMKAVQFETDVLYARRTFVDDNHLQWTELDLDALVHDESFTLPTV